MVIIDLALKFAVLVFLGIFIIRAGIVDRSFTGSLSSFVMKVALPCMIFNSIFTQTFDGDFGYLLMIVGVALLVMAVLAAFSWLMYLLLGRDLFARCSIVSTLFGNFTYVGMAAVESLYGSQGLFVYTIFTLPVRVLFYASPSFLMSSEKPQKRSPRELAKLFLTPPVVAVLVGLVFYFTGLGLPSFLSQAISSIGATASPLGMILCGMGLANASLKSLVRSKRTYVMVAAKNLLSPILVIALLWLLPIDTAVKQAAAIYGCVPVPSLLTAFSIQMGCPDDVREDCSSAVLISTLLCILTLPMWAVVIERVF